MGAINKIVRVILLLTSFFCVSCEDVDITGFFYNNNPVNDRVKESLKWNETNPRQSIAVAGTEYTLLIAGDSHVGGTVNLSTFLNRANTTGASAIIIVGDLTTGHKEDYDLFKQVVDTKNSLPAFFVVGNHDLFFDGWKAYFDYFGSSTYSFKVYTSNATDLYICLDTGSGTLGSRQLEWVTSLLEKERKNVRYCIVSTHVNFIREHRTSSTNILVEELRAIIDLCYKYSIDLVVTGHDHNRSEQYFVMTHFITLDALEDDFENASYLTLHVKEDGLVSTFTGL
jgi:UDP-2,3-diacylglucosamine pyrophosphatase LpxH